ncbi:alkaline phosphatase [Paenibacillus aceris]|uniref:Alkaline phosphatase n=1 Tax=Paenibacillus aceris TaxID=869555 RepID=A0ABS4HSJ5_9BACL|nr:alkaline phosphatase [Paenibacillus aceris]MBP1961490.1 alkaline phosphatase [Paenibacillus aceris]NHW37732.1 alkaline phosphatase [Paenibacillus aceris]
MKKSLKQIMGSGLTLSLLALNVAGVASAAETTPTSVPAAPAQSKNLIVLIGDGMGPAEVTAARYYSKKFLNKDRLELDGGYYVGKATTYSQAGPYTSESGAVTDSAAAATAFSTGNKTYNNAISVSNGDVAKPYGSIIEAAMKQGKSTGLVTTDSIVGATPAVWASHVRQRSNQNAIASQYLNSGVNVFFGGGKTNFVTKDEKGKRTDKNIIGDYEAKGFKTAFDKAGLDAIPATADHALGLFAMNEIPYVLDRDASTPSLPQMAQKALDILSQNKDGFVLMVEQGRIDHAGHANDLPSNIQEMLELDATFKTLVDFAKKDGNTSVVVTADHETGGLSLGINNVYELNVDLFNKQKHSYEYLDAILKTAQTAEDVRKIVADNIGFTDLSDEEVALILKGDGSSYGRAGGYNAVVSKRLAVGWTGHGHTGVDVGVWAYGPIASLVKGDVDNTDIAKNGAKVIGADLAAVTKELQDKYLYPLFKVTRDNKTLFTAKSLAEALDIQVVWDEATKTVTLSKDSQKLSVLVETGAITENGAPSTLVGNVDNGKLYLPLEAFNKLTGKTMTWDSSNERIVKN